MSSPSDNNPGTLVKTFVKLVEDLPEAPSEYLSRGDLYQITLKLIALAELSGRLADSVLEHYFVDETQAGLMCSLIRMNFRACLRSELNLKKKVGPEYDPTRTNQRLKLLSSTHQALGGRELTRENINVGRE